MLTAKQHRVYLFIRDYIARYGYSPTQREIAEGIGIQSRGVVQRYLHALVDAGLLSVVPKRRRNLRLVDGVQLPYSNLPIVGKISAGSPIETIEDEKVLDLAGTLLGPNRFVLQVKGDSMSGDNICDGDYIICEKRMEVRNGDIVVAIIDYAETTLKRLKYTDNQTVTLLPSNPSLPPMQYPRDRVTFKGVYLGLIRLNAS